MKGLSNNSRSFLFLLLNNLLMTKECQHKVTRNTPSPICSWCQSGAVDSSYSHTFTDCTFTAEITNWLVSIIQVFDVDFVKEGLVRLQFETFNEEDTLIITWLVAEALGFAWARRQNRQTATLTELKTDLAIKAGYMSASLKYAATGKKLLDIIEAE